MDGKQKWTITDDVAKGKYDDIISKLFLNKNNCSSFCEFFVT